MSMRSVARRKRLDNISKKGGLSSSRAGCAWIRGTISRRTRRRANSGSCWRDFSSWIRARWRKAALVPLPVPNPPALPLLRPTRLRPPNRTAPRPNTTTFLSEPASRLPHASRITIFLMPKTEVILTSNIVGLGAESDHVKVAAGYARNYLLPQGLAIPLTGANKRRIEVLRQRRAERESHELNSMSELAKSINKMTTTIKVKTGDDGKMFGSVTAGTIADELKHQFDITLDKKKIHLD